MEKIHQKVDYQSTIFIVAFVIIPLVTGLLPIMKIEQDCKARGGSFKEANFFRDGNTTQYSCSQKN